MQTRPAFLLLWVVMLLLSPCCCLFLSSLLLFVSLLLASLVKHAELAPKKFLTQAQPAQAIFQRRLSQRRQFFCAGSACVDILLAQAQPAQANCQRRLSVRKFFPCFYSFFWRKLSLRRHFFSADSACVDIFLAQAQPAQTNFQRRLILRKKYKMANICRSLRQNFFFSQVLKSTTHIRFIGVKKMGRKSHTWAPLKYLRYSVFHAKAASVFYQKQ